MFHEVVPDPGARTPSELEAAFTAAMIDVIESHGVAGVADETGVGESTIRRALAGDLDDVTLAEGAAILALDEETISGDEIVALANDALLLGMSNAVLDVDALASGIDGTLEPKEIQQKVEGRFPMTLAEYALLYQYVESQY